MLQNPLAVESDLTNTLNCLADATAELYRFPLEVMFILTILPWLSKTASADAPTPSPSITIGGATL
jgi:hypothetical protein